MHLSLAPMLTLQTREAKPTMPFLYPQAWIIFSRAAPLCCPFSRGLHNGERLGPVPQQLQVSRDNERRAPFPQPCHHVADKRRGTRCPILSLCPARCILVLGYNLLLPWSLGLFAPGLWVSALLSLLWFWAGISFLLRESTLCSYLVRFMLKFFKPINLHLYLFVYKAQFLGFKD